MPQRGEIDERFSRQRWDDHRYFYHSRINQTLHLVSAMSFLCAYVLVFTNRPPIPETALRVKAACPFTMSPIGIARSIGRSSLSMSVLVDRPSQHALTDLPVSGVDARRG
jgi:hypothetical protein